MVSQLAPRRVRSAVRPLSLARWVALCAIAEGIGMTAAATAAKVSQAVVGEPGNGREAVVALSLVVGGGLVEGIALGGLQAMGLGRLVPGLNRRRWVLGAVQATGLRGRVRHPWRWVGANAAAWAPTMAVIFLGATTPGADWSGPTVAGLGAVTGWPPAQSSDWSPAGSCRRLTAFPRERRDASASHLSRSRR
jgi:hypothetical protein